MYNYDQQPGTHFSNVSDLTLETIRTSEYSVLVGRNNCGKSFVLKSLTQKWGNTTSYLGPARYQNFNVLAPFTPSRDRRDRRTEKWDKFMRLWQQQQQNIDNSPVNLQQAIAELSDVQRATLAEIIENLLGVKLEWLLTLEGNSMSQMYVSCGGHNISYTSSGVRLITTLVTSLLDTEYDTFLIDEPELGISPEAQGILADFLFDRKRRARYFPHIKTLIFATHSTVFLDRTHITNNYTVEKTGDEILIQPIASQADFNRIHFFLLGNRFETLYLPSAIVLVEGKSDHKFVERVVCLRYPNSQISVIPANSDNRIKEVLHIVKSLFADIQRSPYRDRVFVILDKLHSAGLPRELAAMGVPEGNITVWPKNGIEFYYPPLLVDKIFGAGAEVTIADDMISRNGNSHTKADLADKISSLLQADTEMHPEFNTRFLDRLAQRLS